MIHERENRQTRISSILKQLTLKRNYSKNENTTHSLKENLFEKCDSDKGQRMLQTCNKHNRAK